MKKSGFMLLCAALCLLMLAALPFLCAHGSMLPEKTTEYYQQKARMDAETATGAEAELMALLLGGGAPQQEEAEPSPAPALSFHAFGLWIALGGALMEAALFLFAWKEKALQKALVWTALLALPLGLLGGRLVYCLTEISLYLVYLNAPLAMLNIWDGGLSVMGALVFMGLAGVLGAKLGKVQKGKVLDALAFFFPLFLLFSVCPAQMAVGTCYGPEMPFSLPLLTAEMDGAIYLNTAFLTPLVIGLSFLLLHRLAPKGLPAGRLFLYAAFLYGCLMVLMESLRRDGHMQWGFVHAEMLYAMVIALPAGLVLAEKKRRVPLLGATALLAGAVIGLEFMLDRSNIHNGLLYLVYIICLAAYIFMGLKWAKRACEPAKNNV